MPLKTKHQLEAEADILATSYSYVKYNHVAYRPVDFETEDDTVTPPPERTIWLPVDNDYLREKAKAQFNSIFDVPQQLSSFAYMVYQHAAAVRPERHSLLVRTEDGLKELRDDGLLHEPSGSFVPNALKPMLNTNPDDKAEVMATLVNWVNSEEEAVAMLRHFATALLPGWAAVKYVLLLGAGRNGKSLMMHMLQSIFGTENCSQVTRQDMSDKSPVITALNNKLMNIVLDGQAFYLKDSGTEKSLVAGEEVQVRRLYSSDYTPVKTNALFIEALNQEPKSKDKSSALQARIVRFEFPNSYAADAGFWNLMTSERMVGALLALMIDHFVKPADAPVLLAPTAASIELQIDHMFENSIALQFLKHIEDTDPLGTDSILDMDMTELAAKFTSWRLKEMNDLQTWSEADVISLFRPVLLTTRKSRRVKGVPRKIRTVTGFTKDAVLVINSFRGEEAHDDTVAVVED